MIYLIKMAFRDLGRNRRRSFFSALALGIGLALLLLMSTVLAGEMGNSLDTSIKLQTGHLQVRSLSYDESKTSLAWKDLVEKPETVAAQIASLAPVKVATPRLFANGILNTTEQAIGVRVIGIDPASEANAPFWEGLVDGSYLTADDREGIFIGKTLADDAGLKSGDIIDLLVNTSNGDVAEQVFTIRGIYTTHTPGYDENTIFMPLAKAQSITQTENHASAIFILLKDREQTSAVAAALQSNQYQVLTWENLNSLLVQTEDFANAYMYILYLIILAVTATVIVNTLIMAVFERTREIGILSAIGMKGGRIMAMFFAESSLLAIGGILIGLVLGALLVVYDIKVGFYIGNFGITSILIGDTLYGRLDIEKAITLTILAFVVTLVAAVYPALVAARMEPVDALRGGK
jgi:ABC-type lipoprotein release transport system permease subunit